MKDDKITSSQIKTRRFQKIYGIKVWKIKVRICQASNPFAIIAVKRKISSHNLEENSIKLSVCFGFPALN